MTNPNLWRWQLEAIGCGMVPDGDGANIPRPARTRRGERSPDRPRSERQRKHRAGGQAAGGLKEITQNLGSTAIKQVRGPDCLRLTADVRTEEPSR